MGRGRAKAKQTKVARQLKYQPAGDLDRLRSELGVSDPHPQPQSRSNGSRDHDLDERYAAYADYAEGADEEDEDEEDDEDDS